MRNNIQTASIKRRKNSLIRLWRYRLCGIIRKSERTKARQMSERIRWETDGYCCRTMRNAIAILPTGAVYFPIPKAASTAVKHALLAEPWESALRDLKALPMYDRVRRQEVPDNMMIHAYLNEQLSNSLALLESVTTLDDLVDGNRLRCFTIVRNPIDRFVSAWKDRVLSPFHTPLKEALVNFFHTSAPRTFSIDDLIAYSANTPTLEVEGHLKPQWALCGAGKVQLELIGRVEHLNKDFRRLADAGLINCDAIERLTVHNSTSVSIELTGEQRRSITRLYERDFNLFGY